MGRRVPKENVTQNTLLGQPQDPNPVQILRCQLLWYGAYSGVDFPGIK